MTRITFAGRAQRQARQDALRKVRRARLLRRARLGALILGGMILVLIAALSYAPACAAPNAAPSGLPAIFSAKLLADYCLSDDPSDELACKVYMIGVIDQAYLSAGYTPVYYCAMGADALDRLYHAVRRVILREGVKVGTAELSGALFVGVAAEETFPCPEIK